MDLVSKKCVPCEGGTPPLFKEKAQEYLAQVKGWELDDGGKQIKKQFSFPIYIAGIEFVQKVAQIAENEGHHPDLSVGYQKVTVTLTTHAIGGLSDNDFIMAAKIDQISL